MSSFINTRWGIELCGDVIVTEIVENYLNLTISKFDDPFVTKINEERYLRSSTWDIIDDEQTVRELSASLVKEIQGLMFICAGSFPIKIGRIANFNHNGELYNTINSSFNDVKLISRYEDQKRPEEFKQFYEKAKGNRSLMAAISNLSDPIEWTKIYIAIENISDFLGGEKNTEAIFVKHDLKLKEVKRYCQIFRHRGRMYRINENKFELRDVVRVMRDIVDELFCSLPNKGLISEEILLPGPIKVQDSMVPTNAITINGKIRNVALPGEWLKTVFVRKCICGGYCACELIG